MDSGVSTIAWSGTARCGPAITWSQSSGQTPQRQSRPRGILWPRSHFALGLGALLWCQRSSLRRPLRGLRTTVTIFVLLCLGDIRELRGIDAEHLSQSLRRCEAGRCATLFELYNRAPAETGLGCQLTLGQEAAFAELAQPRQLRSRTRHAGVSR